MIGQMQRSLNEAIRILTAHQCASTYTSFLHQLLYVNFLTSDKGHSRSVNEPTSAGSCRQSKMDVNQMHATNIDLRDWIHDKYLVDSANVVAEAEIPNALTEEFQSLQTSNLLSMNNVAAFPPATELNRELAKNPTSAQNCSLPIQEDIENCTQVQQQVLLGEWTIDSKNQSSTARFNTLPDTHNVSAVLRLTPRAAQRTLLPAHADSRDERNIVCGLPTVLFSTSAKTRQGRQQRRQKLFREIKWESQQFTRRRRTEAAQQNRKKLSSLGGQCHRCMKGKKQVSCLVCDRMLLMLIVLGRKALQ